MLALVAGAGIAAGIGLAAFLAQSSLHRPNLSERLALRTLAALESERVVVASGSFAGRRLEATCSQHDRRRAVLDLGNRKASIVRGKISPRFLRPRAYLAGCPRLLSNGIAYRLTRGLPLLVARGGGRYVLRLDHDRPRMELVARESDGRPVGMRFDGPAGRGSTRLTAGD